MSESIDQLQIDIQAQAVKANDAIGKFIGKLDRLSISLDKLDGNSLSGFADGINKLSSTMQSISNINSRKFTSLADNIQKLGNINTSVLNSAAGSLVNMTGAFSGLETVSANAKAVGDMAKNIAKLDNKNVQTAIVNMPRLSSAMKELMTTMSKCPKISDDVIRMTNALGNLAKQGEKLKTATNAITSGLNKTNEAVEKTAKNTFSLSSAIGKFYQSSFYIVNAIKGLYSNIESTADYIEAFNYYNVTFDKITSEWRGDWARFGYSNAEAYSSSFTERMEENLSKLSGIQINAETGLLSSTGAKNLSMNIQEITQSVSQLASVTNSVGQTGELSLVSSNVFTKLSGDISSLFNQNFSAVMKNIQSGLIGQSRSLYKYGIDITNATLQTYAYELGLEKAVSEMTQAEKMQLRMIAILDQSKVSWGDLANTINSPSNMIRQFTTNIKEAGMVLGQLFIPLLERVLPFINGVTIAIKNLLTNIAGLLGIKIDLGSFGQGYTELEDDVDGISDSLDGATESAKQLKNQLQGFDKLNLLTVQDAGGSSGGSGGGAIDLTDEIIDAAEEYQRVWDEAFANMENKAQKFAEKFASAFKPIENIIRDFAIGDFFQAGQDVSKLVVSLNQFLTKAIDSVDWYGIGEKVGEFLAGINWKEVFSSFRELFAKAVSSIFEMFEGTFEIAPLETVLISLGSMPKLLKAITNSNLVTKIKKLATNLKLVTASLSGNVTSINALTNKYPKLGKAVDVVRGAFANFRFGIENGNVLTGLSEGFDKIKNSMSGMQKCLIGAIAGFAEFALVKDSVADIITGTGSLATNIAEIGIAVAGAGVAFSTVFGFPAGLVATAIAGVVGAIGGIATAFNEIEAEKFGESVKNALSNPGGIPVGELASNVANSIASIGEQFSIITEKSQELDTAEKNIEDIWLEIETVRTKMDAGVLSVEEGTAELSRLFGELSAVAQEKFGLMEQTLISAFGENGAFHKYADSLDVDVTDATITAIGVTNDMKDRTAELIALMSNPEISKEEYVAYQEELNKILGTTDDVTTAMGDFRDSLSEIDLSSLLLEDGTIDANAFSEALKSVTDAVEDTDEKIDAAGDSMIEYLEGIKENAKTAEEKAEIQTLIDLVPNAIARAKELTHQEAALFTAGLQTDLLGGIEKVIDERAAEWDSKNPWERAWLSLTQGINSKDEYIKQGVDNFKTSYVDPLSSEIETQMEGVGIEGAGWASDAMEEIVDALFDVEEYTEGNGVIKKTYLNSKWKEMIQGATEGIDQLAKEEGKNSVDGYNDGIEENVSTSEAVAETWLDKVLNKVREVLDSHSPSRITKAIGKDTVDGFDLGIEENSSSSETEVEKWLNGILGQFDLMNKDTKGKWDGIGKSISDSIETAKKNVKDAIDKIKELFNFNLSFPKIKMPHFKIEGSFSLDPPKVPKIKVDYYASGGFPEDGWFRASHGEIMGQFDNGKSVVANNLQITEGIARGVRNANSEQNALLREQNALLRQILAKDTGISSRDIFDAVRSEDQGYVARNGQSAFAY